MKDIGCHKYIGDRIRQLREGKGWKQQVLGQRLGKKTSTISAYETNAKFPSSECLIAMAELFGVSIDTLVYGEQADSISLRLLSQEQKEVVYSLVQEFTSNVPRHSRSAFRFHLLAEIVRLLQD